MGNARLHQIERALEHGDLALAEDRRGDLIAYTRGDLLQTLPYPTA